MTDLPAFEPAVAIEPSILSTSIRGSSLLLVGRALAMVANFGTQVLVVHHLSKESFGSFAYAMAIVAALSLVISFGMDRSVTRFLAIWEETKEYPAFLGALLLETAAICVFGSIVFVAFVLARGWLTGTVIPDARATSTLLILLPVAPLVALDNMLVDVFAVFGRSRTIFFRRYVLTSVLGLAVIGVVTAFHRGVSDLAWGTLAAAAIGFVLYAVVLVRLLRERRILTRDNLRQATVPIRRVFAAAAPLLTTDLAYLVFFSIDAVLLGKLLGPAAVASFRVIIPLAGINELVLSGFGTLFFPTAARFFARNDIQGLRDHYWHTALWVAVLTFPFFAVTFTASTPLTRLLYGSRYAGSATFLALVALGQFVQAALGFNGTALIVFGKLRALATVNLAAIAVNIALNVVLIDRYGPLGAAIAMSASLVAHNVFKQIALGRSTGIGSVDMRYVRPYAVLAATTAALWAVRVLLSPGLLAGVAFAALGSVIVLAGCWQALHVAETIPDLLRVPGLRKILSK